MATYKQVDFVTESKQRGGKRDNAGAKLKHGEKTAVIRLPLSVIERIKQGNFENVTESNSDLTAKFENEIVTNSNYTALQAEIEALKAELATAKANNERLVLKYDSEYLRANGLQNQVTELKRQPDKLRAEITRLKHLEQDCQAIKASGERCDKPAKGKVEFHGVLINVCLQHQNQLMKNSSEPKQQHQSETSEPPNLTPDKVFKYSVYGDERLIALFNDDSRVFFKDAGKRWGLLIGANSSHLTHFTEKEGCFYFGNTEIYPVENFKGKLPKTLIMR